MSKRVVAITGIGTLTPAGRGTEALWARISSGHTCLAPIDPETYFDPSSFTCQLAGQVPAFSEPRVLTEAILAQTDRCSQLALVAVLDALDMAKLPADFRSEDSPVSPERVSLSVATIAAGWTFAEREMKNFWTRGRDALNRYGMTASFPAGPQGHIGIFFGIEGRIRTFISERASGAHALIEGAKAIWRGDAEIVIAGGTEAPLTPLAWAAYHSSHLLQPTEEREDADHSAAPPRRGMLVGEGSTFLLLEEREHARRRGVPILAELRGWGRGTDPHRVEGSAKPLGKGQTQAIQASLAQAALQPTEVDVLLPAGPALAEEDATEEAVIRKMFDHPLALVAPKTILGHLQGAATATDVAIAALALNRQMIPPEQHTSVSAALPNSNEGRALLIRHALILAGGLGGMHASLVINKSEE